MERFMFFDPVETSPGVFDREYTSEEFVRYFATLINTGLMKGFGNELAVTCTGTDLISRIDTGTMFINGRYYENTEVLGLEHDAETFGQNRIDRVVIRLDLRTEGRHVKAFIKKGTPGASPVAPALQRDASVYEMSLARVYITGGQGFFISANITDDRTDPTLCPYATSGILPNLNEAAFTDHVNNTTTAHGINTKQPLITKGTGTIPTSGWVANTGDYAHKLNFAIAGITATDVVNVVLNKDSHDTAGDAELCPTNESYAGGITFFAKAVPTATIPFSYTVVK